MSPYRAPDPPPGGPCPRCGIRMANRAPVFGCSRCRGVWLPDETADVVLRDAPRVRMWWRRAALVCPRCGTGMTQVLVRDVVVDECAEGHGRPPVGLEIAAADGRVSFLAIAFEPGTASFRTPGGDGWLDFDPRDPAARELAGVVARI